MFAANKLRNERANKQSKQEVYCTDSDIQKNYLFIKKIFVKIYSNHCNFINIIRIFKK